MAKYIHNLTVNEKTFAGLALAANEVQLIRPAMVAKFSALTELFTDIENGEVGASYDGVVMLEGIESRKELLSLSQFRSSTAVDRNNVQMHISGITPVLLVSERTIWDINSDYDSSTSDFIVPLGGLFSFDIQARFNNFDNVKTVELGIFKRGSPDDYWFILARGDVGAAGYLQLSNSSTFDMYQDERFCVKILLTPIDPELPTSCDLVGLDDYTAWGYNFQVLI